MIKKPESCSLGIKCCSFAIYLFKYHTIIAVIERRTKIPTCCVFSRSVFVIHSRIALSCVILSGLHSRRETCRLFWSTLLPNDLQLCCQDVLESGEGWMVQQRDERIWTLFQVSSFGQPPPNDLQLCCRPEQESFPPSTSAER